MKHWFVKQKTKRSLNGKYKVRESVVIVGKKIG